MGKIKVSTNQIIWGIFNLGQQVGGERLKEKQEHKDEVHALNVALEAGNIKIQALKRDKIIMQEQIATYERVQNFKEEKIEKTPTHIAKRKTVIIEEESNE